MDLVTPGIGLIFWTTISFLILLFLLGRFAWPQILRAVNKRNKTIEEALKSADNAREEMKELQAENEKVLKEARAQRDEILKEAREMREKMLDEAKKDTQTQIDKMKTDARDDIQQQKSEALKELKASVADISLEMAEKILKRELSDVKSQEQFIRNNLDEFELN